MRPSQVVIYLSAAVPNHTYKLVSCVYKPSWYGWLMMPAICAHWLVLLASQRYYFVQCPHSAYGCWYPATVFMLVGEPRRRARTGCGGALMPAHAACASDNS